MKSSLLSISEPMPKKLKIECIQLGTILKVWIAKLWVHLLNVFVIILTKIMTSLRVQMIKLNVNMSDVNVTISIIFLFMVLRTSNAHANTLISSTISSKNHVLHAYVKHSHQVGAVLADTNSMIIKQLVKDELRRKRKGKWSVLNREE